MPPRSVSHAQYTLQLLQAPGFRAETRRHLAEWMNEQGHRTVQGKPWTNARVTAWLRRQARLLRPQAARTPDFQYPIWDSEAPRSVYHVPAPTAQIHGDPWDSGAEWTAVVEAPVGGPAYGHGRVHLFPTPTAALEHQYTCLFAQRRPGAALVYECHGFFEPAAFMCAETLYDEVPPGALWEDCAQSIPGLMHQQARYYWDGPLVEGPPAFVAHFALPAAMLRQLQWLQQLPAAQDAAPVPQPGA